MKLSSSKKGNSQGKIIIAYTKFVSLVTGDQLHDLEKHNIVQGGSGEYIGLTALAAMWLGTKHEINFIGLLLSVCIIEILHFDDK